MKEEKRIYVVLPATVQVPNDTFIHNGKPFPNLQKGIRHVLQPIGRQVAQACHVVSKLRFEIVEHFLSSTEPDLVLFHPVTTIVLQARDSNEMMHNFLSLRRKKLDPILFSDENEEAYGKFQPVTALAVLAAPSKVVGVLDYLPLWGS